MSMIGKVKRMFFRQKKSVREIVRLTSVSCAPCVHGHRRIARGSSALKMIISALFQRSDLRALRILKTLDVNEQIKDVSGPDCHA